MITKDGTIIWNEWDSGIGASSVRGNADMRNCDPFRKPGYLELAPQMLKDWDAPFSYTVTANASTDILTALGNITRGTDTYSGIYKVVQFTTTGTLPAPLATSTNYYIAGTITASTFQVATTLANAISGTVINITDTGTGTHTVTTVNMGTPRYIIYDATYGYFLQDSGGKIWRKDPDISSGLFWTLFEGNTLTSAQGNGIAIWQGYLFAFRNTAIDVCNLATDTWTNSWKTSMTSQADHYPFVSGDDILYFANDKNVGSIVEVTTFDPSNAATYTYNDNALDTPNTITCFADLGDDLMIGTDVNRIYPWDRTSSSFKKPIILLESNVVCMKSLNNVLYFGVGGRGNIYRTYGTTAESFIDISDEFAQTLQYPCTTSAIILTSNEMLFYVTSGGGSSAALINGIYSANLTTGAYHLKYKFSQGYAATPYKNAVMGVTTGSNNDVIWAGYAFSGTTYVDSTLPFNAGFHTATQYISYATSPLYEVGTFIHPRTFKSMQLILAAPQTIDMGIRVSSRKNLSDSFSQVATFDFATIGSVTAAEANVDIETAQFIQFKIELQQSASLPYGTSSSYATPTIRALIID